MMRPDMVYQFPIWAVGLSLIGTVLLELAVRHFVSAAFRRRHNDIAAAIFSIIGVTYAVLLAFVAFARVGRLQQSQSGELYGGRSDHGRHSGGRRSRRAS